MDKKRFYIFGFIFFLLGLITFLSKLRFYGEGDFLWFCYLSFFLLSFGFLFRSPGMLVSFLSIAVIGQGIWILSIYSSVLFSFPIFINPYFFDKGEALIDFLIGVSHFFMIPFALLGLYWIKKPSKYSGYLAEGMLFFVAISSLLFTPYSSNVNCVYRSCISFFQYLTGKSYSFTFLVVSLMLSVGIMGPLLNIFLNKAYKNKKYFAIFKKIILITFIICIVGIFLCFFKYFSVSHITCTNINPDIYCERVDFTTGNPFIQYHLVLSKNKNCTIYSYFNGIYLNSTSKEFAKGVSVDYMDLNSINFSKNGKVSLDVTCS